MKVEIDREILEKLYQFYIEWDDTPLFDDDDKEYSKILIDDQLVLDGLYDRISDEDRRQILEVLAKK
jgi:hypothetical protein